MIDCRTRFTFRIPQHLLDQLKRTAQHTGTSANALILQILWEWAQKNAPTDKKGGRK